MVKKYAISKRQERSFLDTFLAQVPLMRTSDCLSRVVPLEKSNLMACCGRVIRQWCRLLYAAIECSSLRQRWLHTEHKSFLLCVFWLPCASLQFTSK